MAIEYKHETRNWRLTLAAVLFAATLGLGGCGGGGGNDSDDGGGGGGGGDGTDAPSGDTDLSASDLEGQWVGTLEPYQPSEGGKFQQLLVEFDANGDITRVDLDGSTLTGVTGSFEEKPTDSGQIFAYDLDNDLMYLWVDSDVAHAAIVFEDGTIGVIEKDASTSPTYEAEDAVGSWTGSSVYLVMDPELTEDGFDDVAGSYSVDGSTLESTDLSFTDPDGDTSQDCTGMEHTLSGFDTGYGVYDTATVTGGDGDCPSDVVDADGYVSPDASFMVILAGCEAGDDGTGALDGCSVAVLNKQIQ